MKKQKNKSVRLVEHIKPLEYDLILKPDLNAFVFSGKETIKIILEKDVSKITLHAKNIDIETVEYTSKKIQEFAYKISYDIKAETTTFYFKKQIKKGRGNLNIIFSGIINESLRGFYKSEYKIDNKTKYLATTQFEATDARQAFPCFDEPAQKAIFNVSLIIPTSHTAISNTLPIKIKEHEAGYKIVSFSPTPRMSTYLLAFIIGEFEWIEKKVKLSNKNVLVRVFTTAGKKNQAKFALETAIKSVRFYNRYFNIPYPLPTLDLIAIPDFESGAMENWGAITFRESAILVDEKHTSLLNKQWVAIVIAHELAHQWFGNLVTMHWWTDLWLNEGFASYMENFCIDNLFPDWHIWDLNLINRYEIALNLDSLFNSHPIEIKVNNPNEINEIFDMVSYAKGSAVIRMLALYLGKSKFQDGLQYYLKKHSYKNSKTINLWQAFEKISKKPVKKIMDSWTKQAGYPLVTLDYNSKNKLILKQERFFSSRISRNNNKIKTTWNIPIAYNNKKVLLTKKRTEINEKNVDKINQGEKSFIRVKYDTKTLEKLRLKIISGKLGINDRLGVIRDLFSLAEGGYISTDIALEFSLAYKNETEYTVWSEISMGINRIYNLISDENFKGQFNKYTLELFSPLAKKMTFNKKPKEKYSDVFLRNLAISQAGFYGDKKIIKEAQKLFKSIENKKIETNLRATIYKIVAQNGTKKEWLKFKKLYEKEEMHEKKERYGYALTQFRDKRLIENTLYFIISKSVRNQDKPRLLIYTWRNEYGKDLTWKFIKKNWKNLLKLYGEGGHFLSEILSPLGNYSEIKYVLDAKKFFNKNSAPGVDRAITQAYEKIYSNSAWLKDDKIKIKNWLNNFN